TFMQNWRGGARGIFQQTCLSGRQENIRVEGAESEPASIERSRACLSSRREERSVSRGKIREQRATKKMSTRDSPSREAQKWLISSLLLLEVVPDYVFVVAP
ncbi:MAG: hypothetical protein HYW78_04745, partial [Parcubacteria group bacterium]|nr:hypothetical protein [Parcubacteria group bacterium]